MGFKGIATTLALLAVVLTAGTAQADNRNTVYGYMRSDMGVMLSPSMGAKPGWPWTAFKVDNMTSTYRLGNEGSWYQIGWNLNVYKGDDNVTGNIHLMIDGGIESDDVRHKEFYFDIKNIPGLDAEIWTGQRDWLVNAGDILDGGEYWNSSGIGAGITNLKIGDSMTFHYGVLRAPAGDVFGLQHVVQLRDIPLFPGSKIDVGVMATHAMAEETEGLTSGFSGHLRWNMDMLGGVNRLYVAYGMGAQGDSNSSNSNFQGGNVAASEDAVRAKLVDNLTIRPMPELGVSVIVGLQHDEQNAAAAGTRNWMSVGGRLSYDVSKYISLLLEAGYDMTKVPGVDAKTLIKVTPAIELTTKSGNVPHIRLYGTYASWNDAAALMADENSAFLAGIVGEAWF
jgi:maltoporin